MDEQYARLVETLSGQRVGLLTNPTGVDHRYRLIADRLMSEPEVELVCFFAPEHGLRGDQQAGSKIQDYVDEATGLPVYSLYGDRHAPEERHLREIDAMLADVQDVGSRFYTRIWIVCRSMEACAEAGKRFVIFDRPNPIGLERVEGAPNRVDAGLIGPIWPGQDFGIPTRHGMTLGEIATLVNEAWAEKKADLTVVRVPGLARGMTFEETGYPWVLPSPNMPTVDTAFVYPGICLFESTNLSEGRGTTKPFELIGAPFVDAENWVRRLNEENLPGVAFRPAWFTPTFDDYTGERCAGLQVHVTNRELFDPIRTALVMLKTCQELHPEKLTIDPGVDGRMGVENLHRRIKSEGVDSIISSWMTDLEAFKAMRDGILLY